MSGTLVACFGNPLRGDDGFGPAVAAALSARGVSGCDVLALGADATELLDHCAGREQLIVVDALRVSEGAGTLHVLDVSDAPAPSGGDPGLQPGHASAREALTNKLPGDLGKRYAAAASSHGLGPAAALALARQLGRLPSRVHLVLASAENFDTGQDMSPVVGACVAPACAAIAGLLRG